MAKWYVSGDINNASSKYFAVAQWQQRAYATGAIVRQLATPTVGNERCFKVTGGGGGNSGVAEPTWNLGSGATTTDGALTWTEITGTAENNGDGGGAAWAAPCARCELAFARAAADDIIYVDSLHSQVSPVEGNSFAPPASYYQFTKILSASNSAAPPTALAAGATVNFGSAGVNPFGKANDSSLGRVYFYGFTFNYHTTPANVQGGGLLLDTCILNFNNTSGASTLIANYSDIELVNTVCNFAVSGSFIQATNGHKVLWRDTPSAIGGAAVPTAMLQINGSGRIECHGVDLSALNTNLVGSTNSIDNIFDFYDCKLHASVTIPGTSLFYPGQEVNVVNCDSGATNYREQVYRAIGSIVQDTANYRQGGYAEGAVTSKSLKMVSLAGTGSTALSRIYPLKSRWIYIWNANTGAPRTLSVEYNASAQLKNSDIWLEAEILDQSAAPLATLYSSAAALLATIQGTAGANNATSSETWTQPGISTPTPQKLSLTFTPQLAGPYRFRVCLAKPSTTVWVDPKPSST